MPESALAERQSSWKRAIDSMHAFLQWSCGCLSESSLIYQSTNHQGEDILQLSDGLFATCCEKGKKLQHAEVASSYSRLRPTLCTNAFAFTADCHVCALSTLGLGSQSTGNCQR
ncbi:hypothetical protein HPB48_025246 [Haemaphysalis longicornis]|uniref:Uncharacterized protein n=1 Tax=Haemaphysalis longicornis TaxID=44386 RepID=A0A9J6H7B2_HAELO|nr:hypothetical protein HPB48_025246 [Haemaphysalis longicornis]